MKKFQIVVMLVCLGLVACTGFRQGDFSKKKYLNLKRHSQKEVEQIPLEKTGWDHFLADERAEWQTPDTASRPIPFVPTQSADNKLNNNQKPGLTQNENSIVNVPSDDSTKVVVAGKKKSNELELPEDPLPRFELIFQIGFMLIILAVLFAAMALTASGALMLWFCIIAGSTALITAWIFSFLGIRTSKLVSAEERKKGGFQVKVFLAYFVNVIGWIVLAVNVLLWGIMLLFLL